MVKFSQFKQVHFSIESEGTGSYFIEAYYRGKMIRVHTNDSEAYDWVDDDSDRKKNKAARKSCYLTIKQEYERLYN